MSQIHHPIPDLRPVVCNTAKLELPSISLRIASIDHLILTKRKASRPQDLLDIEQIKKIKRFLDEWGMRPP